MEKNMEHIDNVFREGLGSYTEAPPSFVWDDLEKRLEDDRRKRAFSFRWRWYFTALSMVLVVSGSLAWKMASHPAAANEAVPVENSTPVAVAAAPAPVAAPAAANLVVAAPATTPAKKHIAHKRSIHKESTENTATVTTPVKHETHIARATKTHTATAPTASKTEKHTSSDYDMYEAATSGNDAELANEPTKAEGYVVNARTRHNIKVADMAPIEEKVARRTEPLHEVTASAEQIVVSTMPAATAPYHTPKHKAVTAKVSAPVTAATVAHTVAKAAHNITPAKTTVARHIEASGTKAIAKTSVPAKKVTAPEHTEIAKKDKPAATTTKAVKHTEVVKAEKAPAKKMEQLPLAAAPVKAAVMVAATPAPVAKGDLPAQASATTKVVKAATPAVPAIKRTKAMPAQTIAKADLAKPVEKFQPAKNAESAPAQLPPVAATAKAAISAPVVHKVTTPTEAATKGTIPTVAKKESHHTTSRQPEAAKRIVEAKQKPLATVGRTIAVHDIAAIPAVTGNSTAAEPKPVTETNKPVAGIIPSATVSQQTKPTTAEVPAKPQIARKAKGTSHATAATVAKPVSEAAAVPNTTEPAATITAATSAPVAAKAPAHTPAKAAKMTPAATPVVTVPAVAATQAKAAKASQPAVVENSTADQRLRPHFSYQAPESVTEDYFLAAAKQQKEEAPIPGTFKEEVARKADAGVAPAAATVAPTNEQPKQTPLWRKNMTGGIKVGAEATYTSLGARTAVVSPYLEYQLTPKVSVMLQPAFKLANVAKKDISGSQMWYNVHDDGMSNYRNTDTIFGYDPNGTLVAILYQRNYAYSQSHDSMSKSYNVGGTNFNIDLPIMFKYALSKKVGVYGGVNFAYSKVGINTNTYQSSPIVVRADSFTISQTNDPIAAPSVSSVIRYGNTPLSEPANLYSSPAAQFRVGYVFGVSYEFRRRCLFDALIQQNFANSNVIGGYNVNTALGLPYIRLSLGYRLMK